MEIETGIYKKTVLLSVVVVVKMDVAIGHSATKRPKQLNSKT